LEVLPVGASPDDSTADAVLVIGDRAIGSLDTGFCESWDLGERWRTNTGLPFVFAVWAARPGVDLTEIEPALDEARDLGVRQVEQIADEQARLSAWPREMVLAYLRDHLNFSLGPGERRGLDLFFRRAARLDLAPRNFQLRFDDCPAQR
jgi:chorismate dehydratase